MQLRNMNAQVYAEKNMEIKIGEEIIPIEKCLVFQSYESVCAVYDGDNDTLYLLPRYDYSRTTSRQLTTFLKDFCHYPDNTSIIDVRKWVKDEGEDTVIYADGYRLSPRYGKFFTH